MGADVYDEEGNLVEDGIDNECVDDEDLGVEGPDGESLWDSHDRDND
jgi:hypothetical protein